MDFAGGIITGLILVGLFVLGIFFGGLTADSSWIADCEKAGVHRNNSKVYECKERK